MLECPADRAEENIEMPQDDTGERGWIYREADDDRNGSPGKWNWP